MRIAGDTNCAICAVTGYNPAKPGFLYLLRREFYGQEQRKIGITNVPDARLAKLRPVRTAADRGLTATGRDRGS